MSKPIVVLSVNAAWNLVNFRRSLLIALVSAGYRVIAVAPADGRESELAQLGVEFEPIQMKPRGLSPLADARLLAAYVGLLRRIRPVACLGFTIKPNVYGGLACRLLGIAHIANIAGLGTTFMRRGPLNLVVRQLYAIGLRNASQVFFQNDEDAAHFRREGLVAQARVAVLPGSGVDLVRFVPKYRSPDGRTIFILVARLLRAKGVAEFVEAAARLRHDHGGSIVCRILGIRDPSPAGIDDATLDRWQREGHVEVLDAVSDIRPFVAAADCVVLPSYYPEGTPRSLLEAAASGKAIITTDMPGCRDTVDDAVSGFLCPPRDIAALAAAMERYHSLTDEAKAAMACASREVAVRRFDDRIIVDRYLSVLARIAGDEAPSLPSGGAHHAS